MSNMSILKNIEWHNEKRKISDLKPALYNPRKLTNEQSAQLIKSLDKFNLADPIVINQNNTIIGGHQRINILKTKNVEEVDVRVPDRLLNDNEEKELNLRLNKNLGEWDIDSLANFDEDMLADVGFDSKELDKVFQLDAIESDDAVPDARPTTDIKLGDVFTLGEHRLMCGDSTKREDVEKLMQGKKADMVFTDPPYGVGYVQGKYTGFHAKKQFEKIKNDELHGDDLYNFMISVWSTAVEFTTDGASFYVWSPALMESAQILKSLIDSKIKVQAQIIWNKGALVLSRSDYHWKHENCWYGFKQDDKHYWCGDRKQTTVWDCKKDSTYEHPTQKPIYLSEIAINNSSQRDNIVMDLFLGSGSTLIACEKTSRVCYGMEIDPIYCQVIIDRWEKFTNKKADKIDV